jgi:hypothetical protein
LKTVTKGLAGYKLDLMGLWEVRWGRVALNQQVSIHFFYGSGNENQELGTRPFVHNRIISAVNKTEFVCNRMLLSHAVFAWLEDAIDTSASCLLQSLLFPAIHAAVLWPWPVFPYLVTLPSLLSSP